MRTYLAAVLVIVGCNGKADKQRLEPLVQHKDLGTIESKIVEPTVDEPVDVPEVPEPPAHSPFRSVYDRVPLWSNAPDGGRMVGDWSVNSLGVGPGFVYACADGGVRAAPKAGGPVVERGTCDHAFNLISDGKSMFWCDDRGPKRLDPQGTPTSLVDIADSCILGAVDETHLYYIVPAFEGVPNAGLYRIAKDGGDPQLLLATKRGTQLMVALDQDNVWIGSWGAGTISRMKKTGGAASLVISGQRGIVELAVAGDDLYWYSENSLEIRKRKKRGGATTTLAKNVTTEPVVLHDNVLYWQSWDSKDNGAASTLYKLRIGDTEPTVVMRDLHMADFRVDDDGIYVMQLDEVGVLAIPHT